MCQPARHSLHFGFLFTSRPAPGDGSPVLYEGRPGRGVQGLRRKGLTLWFLHANPGRVPAHYSPRSPHALFPSPRQVPRTAGPENPKCYICRSPVVLGLDPVGSRTPVLDIQCLATTLFAAGARLPGVTSRIPRGCSRSPSSYSSDLSSPTIPKTWVSRPQHP